MSCSRGNTFIFRSQSRGSCLRFKTFLELVVNGPEGVAVQKLLDIYYSLRKVLYASGRLY